MRFAKKVVVAVGLNENVQELMKPLRDMEFLNHSEVHFVHVFNTINYTTLYSEFPLVYPVEADQKKIEESILSFLVSMAKEVMPKNFEGKVIHRCLFGDRPKDKFCHYVDEVKADLVIVPTRQKRGFFESSFAQYVTKHTHANMILLK